MADGDAPANGQAFPGRDEVSSTPASAEEGPARKSSSSFPLRISMDLDSLSHTRYRINTFKVNTVFAISAEFLILWNENVTKEPSPARDALFAALRLRLESNMGYINNMSNRMSDSANLGKPPLLDPIDPQLGVAPKVGPMYESLKKTFAVGAAFEREVQSRTLARAKEALQGTSLTLANPPNVDGGSNRPDGGISQPDGFKPSSPPLQEPSNSSVLQTKFVEASQSFAIPSTPQTNPSQQPVASTSAAVAAPTSTPTSSTAIAPTSSTEAAQPNIMQLIQQIQHMQRQSQTYNLYMRSPAFQALQPQQKQHILTTTQDLAQQLALATQQFRRAQSAGVLPSQAQMQVSVTNGAGTLSGIGAASPPQNTASPAGMPTPNPGASTVPQAQSVASQPPSQPMAQQQFLSEAYSQSMRQSNLPLLATTPSFPAPFSMGTAMAAPQTPQNAPLAPSAAAQSALPSPEKAEPASDDFDWSEFLN